MKNKTFKINTKKRNIIIASVIGVIAITAGTFFGVKAYKEANKVEDPTPQVVATSTDTEKETVETDSSNVTKDETTVAKETKTPATEKPEETKTPATTEETKKPTPAKPANPTPTEKPVKPTPKPESKHTHSYTSTVTTQPTCCKEGVRTYTCSCGDTYTEAIATVAHTWFTTHYDGRPITELHYVADDGFDFTAAGYTEQQTIDYCEEHDCGSADRTVIVGYTEGYDETKCSVCGKIK